MIRKIKRNIMKRRIGSNGIQEMWERMQAKKKGISISHYQTLKSRI